MSSSGDVVAADVSKRLSESLLPLVFGAVARHRPEDIAAFVERLVVLVQPAPSNLIQLALEATPPDSAIVLAAGRISTMPDADKIAAAVEDLMGAVLAGLGEGLAEAAITEAARMRKGGFVIEVKPASGAVRLLLCPEGETLDHGTVLGGIEPGPVTMH